MSPMCPSSLSKNYCGKPSAALRGARFLAYQRDMSRQLRSGRLASGYPRYAFQQTAHLQQQRGFSLVTAIFILVVLAALGAAMARFASVQHVSSALDVQGSRAYQAARAGVEWAAWQAINNSANYPCATAGASTDNLTLPALTGFAATVTCTSSTTTEGGNTITSYAITSKGFAGGSLGAPDYVERDITVNISN